MTQLRALLWKEWREAQIFLWIGLGVLLGLPVIDGWQDAYHNLRFELHASDWVFFVGGIFAVFVSVGITCRDLSGRLEDFWRSRPVAVGRWMLVKYFAGLAIVLTCCVVPVAIELRINRENDAAAYLVWFPFLWTAIFSTGFLAGCLLRKTAQASMIALGVMLLIYFLPLVLPPLNWLNVTAISVHPTEDWWGNRLPVRTRHVWSWLWGISQLKFAAGMLGIAILFTLWALAAVHRDWHVAAGRKMMFGSIAGAFLLLLSTAAFEVGTNMPILQSITLPGNEWVSELYSGHDHATIMVGKFAFGYGEIVNPKIQDLNYRAYYGVETYRNITISSQAMKLGAPYNIGPSSGRSSWAASPVGHPEIQYMTGSINDSSGFPISWMLHIRDITDDSDHMIKLRDVPPNKVGRYSWQFEPHVFGNRLYVPGDQLVILDISQPRSPKIISQIPYAEQPPTMRINGITSQVLTFPIPRAPGLSTLEQWSLGMPRALFENGLLCEHFQNDEDKKDHLALYRLDSVTNEMAKFVKIAERRSTVFDWIFGNRGYDQVYMEGGKIYSIKRSRGTVNSSITVFDAAGPHPLQEIGHFGAPNISGFWPMPDGRCMVGGGNKIWLIGPPPHHNSN